MSWFNKKNTSVADIPERVGLTPQVLEEMHAAEAARFARVFYSNMRRHVVAGCFDGVFDSLNQLLDTRSSKALNDGGKTWVESEESRAARAHLAEWIRECIVVNLKWDSYGGYTGRYVVAFDEDKFAATAPEIVRREIERRTAAAMEEVGQMAAERAAAADADPRAE